MKHVRSLTTRHHIIPRSRHGGDNPENMIDLDRRAHAILHDIFQNFTPSEYLKCFTSRNTTDFFLARAVRAIVRHWGMANVLRTMKDM